MAVSTYPENSTSGDFWADSGFVTVNWMVLLTSRETPFPITVSTTSGDHVAVVESTLLLVVIDSVDALLVLPEVNPEKVSFDPAGRSQFVVKAIVIVLLAAGSILVWKMLESVRVGTIVKSTRAPPETLNGCST